MPERYQNRERYYQDTIDDLENIGVSIQWYPRDTGPSMKLVPTLERFLDHTSDTTTYELVICIDDDLLLDPNMVLAYKSFFQKAGPCVASQRVSKFPENKNISYILGVNTIAMHTSLITKELVQDLIQFNAQHECRMHDDVALIMALHKHQVPILQGPAF